MKPNAQERKVMAKNSTQREVLLVESLESRQMMSCRPLAPMVAPLAPSTITTPSPTNPQVFANIWHLYPSGICVEEFTLSLNGGSPKLPPELDPTELVSLIGGTNTTIGNTNLPTTPSPTNPSPPQVFANIWHLYPSGICVEEFTLSLKGGSPKLPPELDPTELVSLIGGTNATIGNTNLPTTPSPTNPSPPQVFANIWHLYPSGICIEELTPD
jgi:hypothetical protein